MIMIMFLVARDSRGQVGYLRTAACAYYLHPSPRSYNIQYEDIKVVRSKSKQERFRVKFYFKKFDF